MIKRRSSSAPSLLIRPACLWPPLANCCTRVFARFLLTYNWTRL